MALPEVRSAPYRLASKLRRPQPGSGLVDRPRLVARLDEGLAGRVTLVSAPAGYGKSTAVAQWLERPATPRSSWLSLDRFDNDVEQLSRSVVAALHELAPGCLATTEALLSSQNLPPAELLARSMASELEELRQPSVLVLDDYHEIRAEPVHELVRHLVRDLPGALHLVVLTRIDPPLPVSLWSTRHWLHEVRGGDLSFSLDEARAFFTAAGAVHLGDEAVTTLHRTTEGWVAGLRLALLSLERATDPDGLIREFGASDRLVVDYLMDEVLAAQPPEVREFLAVTAPLESFCAPLCHHLLSARSSTLDPRKMIDRLVRGNVFLISLGGSPGWYRYHHLFRQLLLEHLGELADSGAVSVLRRRAGEWLSGEGYLEEALHALVMAGDLDSAADAVAGHLHDVIDRDLSRRTLARWLALFPPGAEHGRLPLIVAALYLKVHTLDIEGMAGLFDLAERTCRDAGNELARRWWRALQIDLEALHGFTSYWTGEPATAHTHASLALASLALASPTDPLGFQRALAIQYAGAGLALAGRLGEAHRFLDEGADSARARSCPHERLYLIVRAFVRLYRGELASCREAVHEALGVGGPAAAPKFFKGHAHLILGSVAYERNLLDDAESHFREIEALRFDVNRMVYLEALLGLAHVAVARGEQGSAERYAATAREHALDSGSAMLRRGSEAFDLRVGFEAGTGPASSTQPPATPDFMYLSLYPPSHEWAWRKLREPSPDLRRVLQFIDETLCRAEAHGVTHRAIQLSILRALALAADGRRPDALTLLADTLRRAEPGGFVRSFVDCGPRLRGLLEELAARRPGDRYLESLLAAFAPPLPAVAVEGDASAGADRDRPEVAADGARRGRPQPLAWEALTNREVDVLRLLQERLSDKEIGVRLAIAPATVRKHSAAIYQKLGVHGRRHAVAAAIASGILEPSRP